ncbi:MAG: PocR ligand-binding domain-containing protein [Clostridia bacterium]|nr:PocR ligand-binding domain-containing protein [Clostridia bacterium]
MRLKYDVAKLSILMQDFANITGLSIALFDTGFRQIVCCYHIAPNFCKELQHSAEFAQKCLKCDLELLNRAGISGKFTSHVCHAGLVDAVMPIIENGLVLGYIMLGRMRNGEPDASLLGQCNFEKLKEYFYELPYYDEKRSKSAASLASIIAAHIILGGMIRHDTDKNIEKAAEYISSHINEPLSVKKLCKIAGINKNALYAGFRAAYSTTVCDYINNKRLETAKRLLCSTSLAVSEIAERVGIENYTYFCQIFKKHTGLSPLKYRKAHTVS